MTRKSTAKKTPAKKSATQSRTVQSKASKPSRSTPSPEPKQSKKSILMDLLKRPKGASIDEMTSATGWQAHSVRAAITGLRKSGHAVLLNKDDQNASRYRIVEAG